MFFQSGVQSQDAYKTLYSKNSTNGLTRGLGQRIKYLETQLSQSPLPSVTSKRRQLCSIEEAWNLPISLEINSRQQQQTVQMNHRQLPKTTSVQVCCTILKKQWDTLRHIIILVLSRECVKL